MNDITDAGIWVQIPDNKNNYTEEDKKILIINLN